MFLVQQPNKPPEETDMGCIMIKFFFFFFSEDTEAAQRVITTKNCPCLHLIYVTTEHIIFYPTMYIGSTGTSVSFLVSFLLLLLE